jgi:PAS domain S-box-containing protein
MNKRSSKRSAVVPIDNLPQTLTILVIEDEPGDFGLVDAYLRQTGFWRNKDESPVVWAKTMAEGVEAAQRHKVDIVLLDLSLPDSSGMQTVGAMNAAAPDVPIVVLTGCDDDELAIAALEGGAQDYLIKGQFDHDALGRAVRHALARGRLESRLRLYEAALNSAANGIVITDVEGRYQWVNLAFSQLTGLSAEDVLGRNPRDLMKSGKQDQAFYQNMWQTILAGQIWHGEIVNRRKDGSLYDEALSIAPVTGGDGTIRNFVAIKQDITERKQSELQIRESEQRLELALAGSDLGLWDWHLASGKMVFNERWCSMLGYRVDELEADAHSWERLVHPEDWAMVHVALDHHLKGETPAYEAEYRLRHKDGHWIWVLDRGKVVGRDEQGNPLRAAGTHLDISTHKRLELEGAHLLKRIESLIRGASERPAQSASDAAAQLLESGKLASLSKRQRQVLQLVAAGCTSAQISEKLHISIATTVTHRRDLMNKLNLHSVAELTRFAIEKKLDSI